MTDLRKEGTCLDGARYFFARNNLEWVDFLRNGIDSSLLLATEDAMAKRLVTKIIERQ
jgi:hypothetical protein